MKTAKEIIDKASELVGGDRQRTHGDKYENMKVIADMWSSYLDFRISPLQASLMMVLLKIARTKTGELNMDDFVDAAGYAGVAGEVANKQVDFLFGDAPLCHDGPFLD